MTTPLPTGTVTFFFSDIEGSTRLVQRLGPRYRSVLGDHNDIVRASVAETDVVEVRTMGDSFFLAFRSAAEAVESAVVVQRSLEEHIWPEEAPMRIRIGMHTGEARLGGDDYIGVDVNRAARISAAVHGGQVLVSASTRAVVADSDRMFTDLGSHRLKDLEIPEHLYQVVVPGLPAEFPPLRTQDAPTYNLPATSTALIGRNEELAAIGGLLTDHRVVTLIGPGGVGKTRLAIAAAAASHTDSADGVMFVDLSSTTDPARFATAIAVVLQVGDSSLEAVADHLAQRRVLLVLDNFEQLLGAAGALSYLLERSPGLRVLVTSRAPLGIAGERRFPIKPLSSAGGGESAGVRLFTAKALEVDPSFDGDPVLISQIVEAVDGLPLAVELAAARAHVLPLDEMLPRLRDRGFLSSRLTQGPERHRSLDDALRWSHDLHTAAEQSALRRLSLFVGGMTMAAAESVCVGEPVVDALESVTELVDRSFLTRATDGSGRLLMLDGVRRFGRDRLAEANDQPAAEAAFVNWFCRFCAEAEPGLQSDRGKWWQARLAAEHDNLRAVLDQLLDGGDADRGLTLLGNIWRFMHSRGHMVELESWLTRFFSLPSAGEDSLGQVKGLMALGALHYWQSDPEPAITDYEQALTLARTLGDQRLVADALYGLATSVIIARHEDDAPPLMVEAERIYRELGDDGVLADVLTGELFFAIQKSGVVGLGPGFKEVVDLYKNAGRMVQATQGTYAQSWVALAELRYEDSRAFALLGLDLAEELMDRYLMAWGLKCLAMIEVEIGDGETAGLLIEVLERAAETHGGGWTPEVVGLEDPATRLVDLFGETSADELIAPGRTISLEEGIRLARKIKH